MTKRSNKLTPELDAAKRLGVINEFIRTTELPEIVHDDPSSYALVLDSRDCHDGTVAVWLAKHISKHRLRVIGLAASLPRRSEERPAIYVEAEKLGVERYPIRQFVYHGNRENVEVRIDAPTDLTDVVVKRNAE